MRGKTERFFTAIRKGRLTSKDYSQVSIKTLLREVDRIASLLDSKDLHDHMLETDSDKGWFDLRDILVAVVNKFGDE